MVQYNTTATNPQGNSSYIIPDKILGYKPTNNIIINAKKILNNNFIYNATYSIDENGLRQTSLTNKYKAKNAILFFGGSFTFGEGVNDNESLPWLLQEKIPSKYKVFNFGFHGYGAHQMLRTLEIEAESKIISSYQPKYLFYTMIPTHIERAAGRTFWDFGGPQYNFNQQTNQISFDGPFQNEFLQKLINKSLLFKRAMTLWVTKIKPKNPEYDLQRFIAIVEKSKHLFEKKYNGKFYVILWEDYSNLTTTKKIMLAFNSHNITFFTADQIFHNKRDQASYYIKHDGHPNKFAYAVVAEFLEKIIQE